MPAFEQAYLQYGDQVAFMMVNLTDGVSDTVENVGDFIAEQGFSFPLYYDVEQAALNAYNVSSVPTTVFIDAEGNIAGKRLGSMSDKEFQAQLDRILDNPAAK